MGCCRGVCVLCAVDIDLCKSHATKAFEPLIQELKTDCEAWARAQEECRRGGEQLCAAIQADTDTKKRALDTEAAALQQQVRAAVDARASAFEAILLKRLEREELVAAAAACPEVAVQGSAAAAVVASALNRAKAAIPSASAAEFRAAAAPAAAVGQVLVAAAVADPEDEASSPCISTSPIATHTSPITHHPSPITHHPLPITHHLSVIIHHPSPITHHLSPITHHTSLTNHPSHITHHQSSITPRPHMLDSLRPLCPLLTFHRPLPLKPSACASKIS